MDIIDKIYEALEMVSNDLKGYYSEVRVREYTFIF